MSTYNQPTASPTAKVEAAGIGGAATTVLIYLVQTYTEVTLPATVAAAIVTLIAFGAAYLKPSKVGE